LGLNAHPVGAEDIGLKLKGKGRASEINIQESAKSLDRDKLIGIPILTGWFGEGEDGNLALLSRGGSDHSAAAFANLMNASKLILWKDVDGIKRLNPRWGIDTPSIPYLGYGQASELSLHGTPIIHPATVKPLVDEGIPLEIRNINNPVTNAPTVIGPDIDASTTIAIGCQPGVAVITKKASWQ
jgi:aspartate kinase